MAVCPSKHFIHILSLAAVLGAQHVPEIRAKPTWLDVKVNGAIPNNWNHAGGAIPHAPRGSQLESLCRASHYRGQTNEEKTVQKAGWILTGKSTSISGVTLVGGEGFTDGMCRPMQFQEFVFVGGVFVGTLSPVKMDSRADGTFSRVASVGDRRLTVDFLRYTEKDPSCCPSRVSQVEYEIRSDAGHMVLAPTSVKTRSTE